MFFFLLCGSKTELASCHRLPYHISLHLWNIYNYLFFAHKQWENQMDKVGKEKLTENGRLSADVCHPNPDVFFLHSFLGVDISHLRTLQGIWTNGFVISPFLPLLRCAFLPFAMNSFIWTCPLPLCSCPLWTPLESYYHCSHPGFGRYVFPLSFFPLFSILSSLFSALSFFLCHSQTIHIHWKPT